MKKLSCSAFLLLSGSAFALPTHYPPNREAAEKIRNTTNSVVLGDSVDARKYYVLPPGSGSAQITSYNLASANLGFCQSMADLQKYSRSRMEDLNKLDTKIIEMQPEYDRREKLYRTAAAEAAALTVDNKDMARVQDLMDRVDVIELLLIKIDDKMKDCGDPSGPLCTQLESQANDLSKEKKTVNNELREIREKTFETYNKYIKKRAVATARKEEWEEAGRNIANLQKTLIEANESLMKVYKDLGSLEGGYASIGYESNWDDAVTKLRDENPGNDFEKSRTAHATIYANFIASGGRDSYLASLPAILDYNVNGVAYRPGDTEPKNTLPAMPSQISATVRLSLVGACPIVHPERFDIPQDNAKLPVFGITSTYDYEAAYKTKIKFSYNMWKFYKRMESSGTKHGFFSSRSWSHITEDRNDGDSFTADWSESDPDNVVPDDQKRIIEQQVKAELIERVLKQFYHPTFSAGISMPSAGTPPTAGAVVIANGIMRTCGGFSFWCSGASFVLKGLYSIFGSSSTEATLQQNYNFTATETWNRETVRYKPAVSVMMETKK